MPVNLEKILKEKPFLANEVIAVVDGVEITLAKAVEILKKPSHPLYNKLLNFLQRIGIDPVPQLTEEQWELALRRWMKRPRDIRIYYMGRWWTVDEIIQHIKARDEIGAIFASMELNSLQRVLWF